MVKALKKGFKIAQAQWQSKAVWFTTVHHNIAGNVPRQVSTEKHNLLWKKHPTFSPLHLLDSTGFKRQQWEPL